jgi:hypothetical protein
MTQESVYITAKRLLKETVGELTPTKMEQRTKDIAAMFKKALPKSVVVTPEARFGVQGIDIRYPSFEVAKKQAEYGIWHNHPKSVLILITPKDNDKIEATIGTRHYAQKTKWRKKTGKPDQVVKHVKKFFDALMKE